MNTLTVENFDNLKKVCEKIIAISNENIEGDLMAVQLLCLGDNIKEFIENPIVKHSGVLVESLLSDYAKKKLGYINGSCIATDFPHYKPSLEWAGAVLDLLLELKLNNY